MAKKTIKKGENPDPQQEIERTREAKQRMANERKRLAKQVAKDKLKDGNKPIISQLANQSVISIQQAKQPEASVRTRQQQDQQQVPQVVPQQAR